jgi:hypothetical protein
VEVPWTIVRHKRGHISSASISAPPKKTLASKKRITARKKTVKPLDRTHVILTRRYRNPVLPGVIPDSQLTVESMQSTKIIAEQDDTDMGHETEY